MRREPREVAHEAILLMMLVAVAFGVMTGYFFASANANQRCKDAWQRYEKEAHSGKRLSASSLTR